MPSAIKPTFLLLVFNMQLIEYNKNFTGLTTKEKPNSSVSIPMYSNLQHGKLLDTNLFSKNAIDQQHVVDTTISNNKPTDIWTRIQ